MTPTVIRAALSLVLLPQATSAQQQFDRTPTCPECRIELEEVVTLGSPDGEGALATSALMVRMDSRGRFVVLLIDESPPYVFSADGSFIQRLGREGEGPGEYLNVWTMEVSGDELYIFDRGINRLTTLDLDFNIVETAPVNGRNVGQTLHLDDGRLVVAMDVPDVESRGFALHFLDRNGKPYAVRDEYPYHPGIPWGSMRHLMLDDDGSIWSLNRFGPPRIRKYSSDGDVLGDWSAGESSGDLVFQLGDPSKDIPPTSQVLGGWVQGGLVWIVSTVPDERWRDSLEKVEIRGRTRYHPTNMLLLYDGLIEVFDPQSGTVIASRRADATDAQLAVGRGLTAQFHVDDLGWYYIDISRARLAQP
jgi:hypothetical protein